MPLTQQERREIRSSVFELAKRLYKSKKITKKFYEDAVKINDGRKKPRENALKEFYDKLKFADKQEIAEKVKHSTRKAKKTVQNYQSAKKSVVDELRKGNEYSVSVILYEKMDDKHEKQKGSKYVVISGDLYKQFYAPITFSLYTIVKMAKYNETYFLDKDLEFIIDILLNGVEFADKFQHYSAYIDMIYLYNIVKLDGNASVPDLLKWDLKDETQIEFIQNNYIQNETAKDRLYRNLINEDIKDDISARSCFINLILKTYKKAINELGDGKGNFYYKEKLTRAGLLKLLGIKTEEIEYEGKIHLFDTFPNTKENGIGLSIENSIAFFKKYRLKLFVFDICMNLIYKYEPENPNRRLSPNSLYVLVHNGHIFRLDKNLDSLSKKVGEVGEYNKLNPSPNYRIYDLKDDDGKKSFVRFVKEYDDITKELNLINENHKFEKTDKVRVRFIMENCLEDLLNWFIQQNTVPNIKMNEGCISSINFEWNTWFVIIDNGTLSAGEYSCANLTKDIYDEYCREEKKMYQFLINRCNLSTYKKETADFEKNYPLRPVSGVFQEGLTGEFCALDMNKAYTSNLFDMEKFPVFNMFDNYETYKGEKIEKFNMYLVQVIQPSVETAILFGSKFTRVYGEVLMKVKHLVHILYVKRPSNIYNTHSKKFINELYASKLPNEHKKFIVNMVLGLIEKKFNRQSYCKVFLNYGEALAYRLSYGGRILAISKKINRFQKKQPTGEELVNPKPISNEEMEQKSKLLNLPQFSHIWVWTTDAKTELQNGFVPIKEYIYSLQRLKLYEMYELTKQYNPVGIKTDCLLFGESDKEELVKSGILEGKIGGNIGQLKWETEKRAINIMVNLDMNELVLPPVFGCEKIELMNEWNVKELPDRTQILAEYAGCGKTYLAQSLGVQLFATPFNRLAQELRKDGYCAETVDKLLGLAVDENAKVSRMDISGFNAICFDEVYLNNVKKLEMLLKLIEKNPDKKFYATGDWSQLEPVGNSLNNIENTEEYVKKAICMIFGKYVMLEQSKRLKNESDRHKMKQLKADVFNLKKDPIVVLENAGFHMIDKLEDVKTTRNICFFNYRRKMINKIVYNKLKIEGVDIGGVKYAVGMEVICSKHHLSKGKRLYVNYSYVIKEINVKKGVMVLEEPNEKVEIDISFSKAKDSLSLPYANTCHAVQGLSIDDEITIFDVNTNYASRKWIYTAITRARDFSKVHIFKHSEKEAGMLKSCKIDQYFKFKVEGYKQQDMKAGRKFEVEKFVSVKWINEQFHMRRNCGYCGIPYEIHLENGNVKSNITVNRLFNDLPHYKDNCELCCLNCNCKLQ